MRRAKARVLPPLPTTTPSILGPITTKRVKGLRGKNGEELAGFWHGEPREVSIETELSDVSAWQTYWHEWAHIVLADAGIRGVISHALTERLCDAFGNARTREMLDR